MTEKVERNVETYKQDEIDVQTGYLPRYESDIDTGFLPRYRAM